MNTLTLQPEMLLESPASSIGIRLLGLPAEKSAKKQLSGSADEVVRTIASVLEQLFTMAIDQRTAQEFSSVKAQVFPQYVQVVVSLAAIVSATVPAPVISRLAAESFSELEADIREHALAAFGADMRDRAMFTVWTLRKIAELLSVMVGKKIAEEDGQKQKEFLASFLVHALSARFNIDCLRIAMRSGRTIYPDVLPALEDGLRSVVDAYAWIRQTVDLYDPRPEPELADLELDEEDRGLLEESMYDLDHEAA
jgi:hypothetical protein